MQVCKRGLWGVAWSWGPPPPTFYLDLQLKCPSYALYLAVTVL